MMRSTRRPLRRNATALLALATTALLGCPGHLDDRFYDSDTEASAACSGDDLQRIVFNASCTMAGCHDNSNQPSGGLDLLSPGAEQRLVGMRAPAGQVCSTSMTNVLVVPGDTAHSLLLLKVEPSPPCGSRMPVGLGATLTDTQIACIRSWIASLPPGTPFDSGPPPTDAARDATTTDGPPADAPPTDGAVDARMPPDASMPDVATDVSAPDAADATSAPDAASDVAQDRVAPADTGGPADAGASDAGGDS